MNRKISEILVFLLLMSACVATTQQLWAISMKVASIASFPRVNLVTLKAIRIVQTLKYSLILQYLRNLLLREHYATMRFRQTGGTANPHLKSFKEFAMVLLLLPLVRISTYLVLFSFTIKLTCCYRDFIKVISSLIILYISFNSTHI